MRLRLRSSRTVHGGETAAATATVRVEPKTFFANERTLLQWLNIAVLLASVAITLLSFGQTAAKAAGLLLSPVAVFFIGYSFLIYLRRSRALLRKEPIDYNDHFGPAVLVVSLMLALCANIVLNVVYTQQQQEVETTRTQTSQASVPSHVDAGHASLLPASETVIFSDAGRLAAAAATMKLSGLLAATHSNNSAEDKNTNSLNSDKRLNALKAAIAAASENTDESAAEKEAALRLALTRAVAAREIARVRAAEAAAAAAAAEEAAEEARQAQAAAERAQAAADALRVRTDDKGH